MVRRWFEIVGVVGPELMDKELPVAVVGRSAEDEHLVLVVVFRMNFHCVENAMVDIFGRGSEYHFGIAGYFKVDVGGAVVGEGVASNFCTAVLEDGDFGFCLNGVVDTLVFNLVGGEADVIVVGQDVER